MESNYIEDIITTKNASEIFSADVAKNFAKTIMAYEKECHRKEVNDLGPDKR